MKEEILKRAMFAMPLSKEAQGTGIMSGFDMEEMDSMDEDVDENADMEEMPPMARTPQNPEILMNTLRGDMRSLDARYMELAQMVGEEAAMETPPEVLAMLMGQMGAQQSGIGALPQGQDMMPPGAGMPPPDQMGAPQPAPAMPQGGIPMPSGMESAPPFSPGAEAPQQFNKGGVAKRRGDDAQLLEGGGGGGGGGFTSPTFSAPPVRPPAFEVTPTGQAALARPPSMFNRDYLGGLNQYLGGKMMAPQPSVSRLTGGSPPVNLTRQQRDALVQNPTTGVISQGTGTRLAPYTTMAPLTSPTLSQGFTQGLNRVAAEYPRVAALLPPSILAAVGIVGPTLTEDQRSTPLTALEQAKYDETMRQIDAVNQPTVNQRIMDPRDSSAARKTDIIPPALAVADKEEEEVIPAVEEKEQTTNEFINQNVAKTKALTRMERIKQARGEYEPLYKELLGDTKEDAKTNALLLLADAGLKLAYTSAPTIAMAVAESAKDLPRGLAAIVAQDKDRDIKVRTAALSQAISDVTAEDVARRAREDKLLDIDKAILVKQIEASKGNQHIRKKGEAGLLTIETKNGDYVETQIDPNNSFVKSVLESNYRHNENSDPFVKNLGNARTTVVEDGKQRLAVVDSMNRNEDILAITNELKDLVQEAYSPGTFIIDKVNKIIVPIAPNAVLSPNIKQEAVLAKIKLRMNSLIKLVATADRGGGRLSNYAEQIERIATDGFNNPAGFLENPEIAATGLKALETNALNDWNRDATRLGMVKFERVRSVPNLGTMNDPFVLSSDANERQVMFNYLGNSFGQAKDPNAKIYVNMGGSVGVQYFTPLQLREKAGLK